MEDTDRMTGAELRVVREYLGLTTLWLADQLGVAERTIHRWESDTSPIPEGVRLGIEQLEIEAANRVTATIAACNDMPTPRALTYRTDADYLELHPDATRPASWHRALTARVAQEVPGLVIEFPVRADLRTSPADDVHATVLTARWEPLQYDGVLYLPFGGSAVEDARPSRYTYYPASFFSV